MNRLVVILCILYVLSPFDLLPDIPVIGYGDDLIAALVGLRTVLSSKKS